jgi:hypothetical protein
MDKRQKFHAVLGVAAFVIGGLLARVKAIEMAETVEVNYLGMEPLPDPKDEDK